MTHNSALRLTLILSLILCVFPFPARAGFYRDEIEVGNYDGYRATRIWWKNWSAASSEELWKSRTHHQFPLSHLFDGDPTTTWADSSPRKASKIGRPWRTRFGLEINTESPARIDELWIMNGYNKDQELFLRNDRIVEMQIWINDTKVKTVRLSDRMGWHKMALPPNNFHSIGLLFTGIRQGDGPDNDVCVSEMALRYRGSTLNMKMPRSVFFEDGNYSGDAPLDCALIAAHGGRVITQGVRPNFGLQLEAWNSDVNYVCSSWRTKEKTSSGKAKNLLWIADVNKQQIVQRAFLPVQKDDDGYLKRLQWLDDKTLEVQWVDFNYGIGSGDKETIKFRKQYKVP